MARLPDDPPPHGRPQPDAQPDAAGPVRSLVERAEVVRLVAAVVIALSLLGLIATLRQRSQPPGAGAAPPRFLTDINAAPATELALLPGIGPELAGRIVAERQSAGPFTSAAQLSRVHGIGPKTIDEVAPLLIFGGTSQPPTAAPPERDHVATAP